MLDKVVRRIVSVTVEFMTFILRMVGYVPSHHVRRFFYRLFGVKIGKGSTIHTGAVFYEPFRISLGEDTIVGENAVLDGRGILSVGNHVAIGSEVMIYNSEHNIEDPEFKAIVDKVIVDDYVFIGPRAIILPGVTIGKGAIIGAGAVVTKDVPPFGIVGGVPAKIIGERKNKDLRYRLGRARWFR